jgi:hypothetical protein
MALVQQETSHMMSKGQGNHFETTKRRQPSDSSMEQPKRLVEQRRPDDDTTLKQRKKAKVKPMTAPDDELQTLTSAAHTCREGLLPRPRIPHVEGVRVLLGVDEVEDGPHAVAVLAMDARGAKRQRRRL